MSQEATILDHGLKLDTREAADETSIPRTGRIPSETSALAKNTVRPLVSDFKRSLSERIKDLYSKLLKALEGDHEFHKYLGM